MANRSPELKAAVIEIVELMRQHGIWSIEDNGLPYGEITVTESGRGTTYFPEEPNGKIGDAR